MAIVAFGKSAHSGRLTGTWSGYIAGDPGNGVQHQPLWLVVNAKQTAGSWKINATCRGPLKLDSNSNGYHHYLRELARGSICAGGDIDSLKRVGPNLYDAIASHKGGEYDASATLRRVRT